MSLRNVFNTLLVACGLFCCTTIVGCSGGSSAPPAVVKTPASGGGTGSGTAPGPSIAISIAIPKRATATATGARTRQPKNGRRTPDFISPSSESISIQVNSAPATFANLSLTNPNCSLDSDEDLVCDIDVEAPAGNDSLAFALYDQPGAAGNLLATSSQTIDLTDLGQSLAILMHGVPRSIVITPSVPYTALSRMTMPTPTFVKLAVAATDADNNLITDDPSAPISYDAPITITDREQTGSTTGLVVVAHGAPPIPPAGIQKSVLVTDPSQDVYAVYYGGFIRAVAFDATSSDVTNPSQLTPGGFTTDCGGTFAVADTLPGDSVARVRPKFARQPPRAFAAHPHRNTVNPVFGGGQSAVYYDSNYLTGCTYDGTDYDCNIETFTPGECISMGMGFDDGSMPNDNETLTWTWNGASNLVTNITPGTTTNGVPTCYELYVPPAGSIGGSDIWQPDVGVPWIAGTILNLPVTDVGESVASAVSIAPSTYHDDLEDCVTGTKFPDV